MPAGWRRSSSGKISHMKTKLKGRQDAGDTSLLVTRRKFIQDAVVATAGIAIASVFRVEASANFDVVIKNAQILDGTGGPAFQADLGITGDQISAVGTLSAEQAKKVIDGSGMHICPGFIDIHSHSDF